MYWRILSKKGSRKRKKINPSEFRTILSKCGSRRRRKRSPSGFRWMFPKKMFNNSALSRRRKSGSQPIRFTLLICFLKKVHSDSGYDNTSTVQLRSSLFAKMKSSIRKGLGNCLKGCNKFSNKARIRDGESRSRKHSQEISGGN